MDSPDKSQSSQPSPAAPLPAPRGRSLSDEPVSQASPPSPASRSQTVPLERDLTNRLVGVIIWFSLATSAGCVMEMAETKGRPNVAEAMKLGMVAAIACAYKDLEKSRMPLSLLKAPQQFFSKLIVRLDNHSVQLEENTVGQVQLEEKIDALTHRVDTLTLAMVRPLALSDSSDSSSIRALTDTAPAPAPPATHQPIVSNGHSHISNGQFDIGEVNSHDINNGHSNGYSNGHFNGHSRQFSCGKAAPTLGAGFSSGPS